MIGVCPCVISVRVSVLCVSVYMCRCVYVWLSLGDPWPLRDMVEEGGLAPPRDVGTFGSRVHGLMFWRTC